MKKKILIIHHHKKFGGASKSLSEFIQILKNKNDFEILCPYGSTFDYFKKKKFKIFGSHGISSLDITEIGLYKGSRLLLIFRELYFFLFTIYAFLKIKNKKYDLVHLNDTNLLILAPIISFFFKAKIICHIRTRLEKRKHIFTWLIKKISKNYISCFISIDKSTFSTSFDKQKTVIIYNIFSNKKLKKKVSKSFRVGFIGSLDYNKGLDFLLDCIRKVNEFNLNIKFKIAGELSVKNNLLINFLELIHIKKNINKKVKIFSDYSKKCHFLGSINNLDNFYRSIDLIVFPSRMKALGRPIIEASSYSIPSLVCLDKAYNDTFINGKTGYAIKFGNKQLFIKNLLKFYNNKSILKKMGKYSKLNYKKIHNYKKNIKKLNKIYIKFS